MWLTGCERDGQRRDNDGCLIRATQPQKPAVLSFTGLISVSCPVLFCFTLLSPRRPSPVARLASSGSAMPGLRSKLLTACTWAAPVLAAVIPHSQGPAAAPLHSSLLHLGTYSTHSSVPWTPHRHADDCQTCSTTTRKLPSASPALAVLAVPTRTQMTSRW